MVVLLGERKQAVQEFQVDRMFALARDALLALPLAELPRLIAADMEAVGREVRQQFGVQGVDEGRAFGGGGECAAERAPASDGVLEAVRAFRQMLVVLVSQPAFHVAERVLVWHQFDSALRAIAVDLADFLRSHRRGVLPDGCMVLIREGMFGVELQLVVAQQRKRID